MYVHRTVSHSFSIIDKTTLTKKGKLEITVTQFKQLMKNINILTFVHFGDHIRYTKTRQKN